MGYIVIPQSCTRDPMNKYFWGVFVLTYHPITVFACITVLCIVVNVVAVVVISSTDRSRSQCADSSRISHMGTRKGLRALRKDGSRVLFEKIRRA